MKKIQVGALIFGLFSSVACLAAAPADAPAGATGLCKDGTYYTGAEKKGACKGHKGVKDWYAEAPAAKMEAKSTSTKTATTPVAATAAAPAAAAPASAPTKTAVPPAAAPSKSAAKPSEMPTTAAAGGGPGKVWVNTSSKVYHCSTDKWYGKTKQGEYMSEADAKAKGFHADHGKACS